MSTTKIATLSRSSRSLSSSKASRGKKKSNVRPILSDALFTDLQTGSYIASLYSIVVSFFSIALAIFDIYCLAMAEPGQTHYGYYIMRFDFVFAGNAHIRRTLLACAVMSLLISFPLLFASFILMLGLRREHEQRFRPWLIFMMVFIVWKLVSMIFRSVVNDLLFSYHVAMLVIWLLIIGVNIFFWLVVFSNYQELSSVTRLEDMAKLKMGTVSSLNTSHASHHSMHSMNSRPTTPSGKGSGSTAIA